MMMMMMLIETVITHRHHNASKRAFCHASSTVCNSLPQNVISNLTEITGTFKISNLLCTATLSYRDT